MTIEEKLAATLHALETIQLMIEDLHTMKGLRVWATEENRELKVAMRNIVSDVLAKTREG